ncbi:MAG: aminopeptidase N [Flavobacteriales bacterium]|jgi:aminopeptidase N
MKYSGYLAIAFAAFISSCSSTEPLMGELGLDDDVVIMEPMVIETQKKVYNASERKVNDLIHTRLDITLDWEKQHLLGQATLEFKPYFYATDRLLLDAKGFDIHKVALVTDSGYIDLEYKYDNWILDIALNKKYSRIETYTLFIDYTAKPNDLPIGGSDAILSDKGLYFINPDSTEFNKPTQLWTQGETESSSCWFPTIDSPNERMTQEIFITVDKSFATLSNGEHVYSNFNADDTRTDYWKMEQSHSPYLVMIAVGDFVVAHDKWAKSNGEEIPVNYYMERDYADYAYKIFGNTPEMLEFYSKILNYDYPWSKYSQVIVRDYVSGAMENTTAVIHGDFLNSTDRHLLDYDNEDIIAHELFHHWFGDLVTCESWANLPLNESFATYGEYMWIEHKYGKDGADWHAYESMLGYFSESTYKSVDLIRFDYSDKEDMFDSHSYNKGGAILHMLRNVIGDEAFFQGMNTYLVDNEFKDAEVHNVRLAFEKVTGMDLNWFFNQWFLNNGHPIVDINYTWNEINGTMEVSIEQTQDLETTSLFRLPMFIDVFTNGVAERHEFVVDEFKEAFIIPCTTKPDWVNVDGDKSVLWEKNDNKPETWYALQYKEGKDLMDRYEALKHLIDNPGAQSKEIVELALNDPYWRMRRKALDNVLDMDPTMSSSHAKVTELTKDEKSLVRADAISTLSSGPFAMDHLEVYDRALKDQSYAVITAGLIGITQVDRERGLAEAKRLEASGDKNLILPIAQLYAFSGTSEDHKFFKKHLGSMTEGDLYEYVGLYGDYLMHQDDATINDGLIELEKITRHGKPWWIKFTGYQAMSSLLAVYNQRIADTQQEVTNAEENNGALTVLESLQQDLDNAQVQKDKIVNLYEVIRKSEKDPRITSAFED